MLRLIFMIIGFGLGDTIPVNEGRDVGEVKEYLNKYVVSNPGTYGYVAHLEIIINNTSNEKVDYKTRNCAGVILDLDVVLTAAHCIGRNEQNPTIWVWAGILDTIVEKEKGQRILAENHILHENYAEHTDGVTGLNDIAILWLETPLRPDGKRVKLATLPERNFDVNGRYGWIVGWGLNSDGKIPAMLQSAFVRGMPQKDCQGYYKSTNINENTICTISDDRKSGNNFGDSGGPFIVDGKVIGLSSFGAIKTIKGERGQDIEVSDSRFPAVYTDISKYLDWIDLHRKKTPTIIKTPPKPPKRVSSLKCMEKFKKMVVKFK